MTGALASRADRLLPWPIDTDQAVPSEVPSATWPIDLEALPPDWPQSSFWTAAGRLKGKAAVAGSTAISVSPVRTEMRSPTTGVFGLAFLKGLQPPTSAAAARTRAILETLYVIGFLSVLSVGCWQRRGGIDAKRAGDLHRAAPDGIW